VDLAKAIRGLRSPLGLFVNPTRATAVFQDQIWSFCSLRGERLLGLDQFLQVRKSLEGKFVQQTE